jgi:nucleoside-diphosphate-sugar epimerase
MLTESAATKTTPSLRGSYAASKLAAEQYLSRYAGEIKLSFVRPACIVGRGMYDPIGSIGVILPTCELLVLGPATRRRPVVARSVLREALARLVNQPPQDPLETLLAVDRDSPTCLEYLRTGYRSLHDSHYSYAFHQRKFLTMTEFFDTLE